MLKYSNYIIRQAKHYAELRADYVIHMDDDSEMYVIGTPAIWDDTFLSRVSVNDYFVYHICTKTIPHGQYNRVTDYQKVWKLKSITQGIYDNSYLTSRGKVYFGITRLEGLSGFYSDNSSLVILCSKKSVFPCDLIFQLFSEAKYDPANDIDRLMLKKICDLTSAAYVLLYNTRDNINLKIYSSVEKFPFTELDVAFWEGQDTLPVYRKPL